MRIQDQFGKTVLGLEYFFPARQYQEYETITSTLPNTMKEGNR